MRQYCLRGWYHTGRENECVDVYKQKGNFVSIISEKEH